MVIELFLLLLAHNRLGVSIIILIFNTIYYGYYEK